MLMMEIAEKAKKELAKATGLTPATVIAVAKDDSKGWEVILEMVERHCIPDAGDCLGIYQVQLDEEGNLISFKRKRTRKRMDNIVDDDD